MIKYNAKIRKFVDEDITRLTAENQRLKEEVTVERFGHEMTYTHVKSIGKSVELAKKCHEFYTRITPRQDVITRIYCNSTGARTIIYKKEN